MHRLFRKYGEHLIVGKITEIFTDELALKGIWASIKIYGGDLNDPKVNWLVKNGVQVLIPAEYIEKILD